MNSRANAASDELSTSLGLEAQRPAVANYLNGGDWHIQFEFKKVESGRRPSTDHSERKQGERERTLLRPVEFGQLIADETVHGPR